MSDPLFRAAAAPPLNASSESAASAAPPWARYGYFDWAHAYRARFLQGFLALIVTNVLGYFIPLLLRRAIDGFSAGRPLHFFAAIAGGVFALAVIQAVIRIQSRLLIFNAARDIETDIRAALFAHVLELKPAALGAIKPGDLLSRLTSDLTNVRLLFGAGLLNIVNTLCAYAVALPFMFSLDVRLTLIALAPYPVMLLLMALVARRIFRLNMRVQESLGALSQFIGEDLEARLYISASDLTATQRRRFSVHNRAVAEANLNLTMTRAVMGPMMGLLGASGIALMLWFGGGQVVAGRLTLGTLIAMTSYIGFLAWPTLMFGFMFALVQRGRAAYGRLRMVFAQPAWVTGTQTLPPGAPLTVELRHLNFGFGGEHLLLKELSLTIAPHERIGIVGEVGSGKSTLLMLLARLLEAPAGTLFFNGIDADALALSDVRARIGYVPQSPFLFSMSVSDNIALGLTEPTPEVTQQAAEWACFASDVRDFANGFETLVGERGVTLSGGQKQRLALARALAKPIQLLLLDDAFSAIDAQTEQKIISHLISMSQKCAMVIATHRLSLLSHVDRIIVLKEGRIAEMGDEQTLLRQGGLYAQMYAEQRAREDLGQAQPLELSQERTS